MSPTLNIIGCGRLGRTLARLWSDAGVFTIGDINDRTPEKSRAAVAFIGAGRACAQTADMRPADLWLLAPPDDRIRLCCEALAGSGLLAAGNIVFHCSGALSSQVLSAAAARGALPASVHPLKTFADAGAAVLSFAGSFCAAEGEAAALSALQPAFERIGAQLFALNAAAKTLYHAASVIMCNYLTALLETGARSFEAAGLPRNDAMRMVEPLVRQTLDNVFVLGPERALTGPIARGDVDVVRHQLEALTALDARIAEVYRSLGVIAAQLASAQGGAGPAALAAIAAVLQSPRG